MVLTRISYPRLPLKKVLRFGYQALEATSFAGYRSSESLSSRAKLISSLSLFRGLGRIGEYITRDFSSLNRFFGSWRYRDSVLAAYDTLRGPFTVRLASKILASKANTEFLESKTNLADLPGFQMVQKLNKRTFTFATITRYRRVFNGIKY